MTLTALAYDPRRAREHLVAAPDPLPSRHPRRSPADGAQLPVERLEEGELIRPAPPEHPLFERLRVTGMYEAISEPVVEVAPSHALGDRRGALARRYADSGTAPGEKIGLIVDAYV
jgi:hypothetical protein